MSARPEPSQARGRLSVAAPETSVECREVAESRGEGDVADPKLPARGVEQHGGGAREPFIRDKGREAQAAAFKQQVDRPFGEAQPLYAGAPFTPSFLNASSNATIDIVRAGLNYNF